MERDADLLTFVFLALHVLQLCRLRFCGTVEPLSGASAVDILEDTLYLIRLL